MTRRKMLKKDGMSIHRVYYFLGVLLLTGILTIYFFQSADSHFQNDSESLVVGRMVAEMENLKIDTEGYGLGSLTTVHDPKPIDSWIHNILLYGDTGYYANDHSYRPYSSQIGLQGHIFAFLARTFQTQDLYQYLRLLCCFLFVIVLLGIIWQLYIKYGILFSSVFLVVSILSPWIVDFSRNLYWVEFTWFIPMLIGLLCLNYPKRRGLFYLFFFLSILVKCLCGYEYISTIMFSGILFLILEWICNKEERKKIFGCILLAAFFSLAGFFSAFLFHASLYGKGDIASGIDLMYVNLIQRHTYGKVHNFTSTFTESVSVFSVLGKYLWHHITGKFILLLLIVTCACLIYQKIILKREMLFEISLFILTFIAPISWFIMAKTHSYIHIHMNFVLWYMGWVQVCVYLIIKTWLGKRCLKIMIIDDVSQ